VKPFGRNVREGWKTVAHWLGDTQTTLIYALIYVFVVGPLAVVWRPFTDSFGYRRRRSETFWVPRAQAAPTLEEARRR
jgi:hypothetical protein